MGPHGEGRHTTLDKDLKRSVDWLHQQAGVKRIILGPISVCKHHSTPGTLRIVRDMPGGLELKGFFGVGLRPLYLYHSPGMDVHLRGKITERFGPRLRVTAKPDWSAPRTSPRDQDFDKALEANGFHWLEPAPPVPVPAPPAVTAIPARAEPAPMREDPMKEKEPTRTATPSNGQYLTVKQAARLKNVSTSAIQLYLKQKQVPGTIRLGALPTSAICIPAAEVAKMQFGRIGRPKGAQSPKATGTLIAKADIDKLNTRIDRLSGMLELLLDSMTKTSNAVTRTAEDAPASGV